MRKFISVFLTIVMLLLVMKPMEEILVFAESRSGLFINEIMAANSETLRDGDVDDPKAGSKGGAYSDWIEIYNSNSEPIDLTGYTLSDSKATWTFPKGRIEANGYLLVWASDKDKVAKDGQFHVNFKLSASGDMVVLKAPNGTVIDSVTFGSLDDDQSYGRKIDGAAEFETFTKSTPLKANANGLILVKSPVFSKEGGYYTEEFDLKITSEVERSKIYYTTDGSDPEPGRAGTTEYNGTIKIKSRAGESNVLSMIKNVSTSWKSPKGEVFKGTTLKAVVVRDDGAKSKVITHTYFVDQNIKSKYSLPVISIVTDYDNLFDSAKGIYTINNATKSGDEWERPAHIEFFETNGKLGFSQNIGIRIHGAYSRAYPQKSLRIYADGDNGDLGKIKYEIFPGLTKAGDGKSLKSFERLILRNAGNDWNVAYMRDEMTQSLVSHIEGLDTQAARPSILFLNGEYWGVYYIRERYDKDYLKTHYDLDDDKVTILQYSGKEQVEIQQGNTSDADAYTKDVINYLKSNPITDQNTYEYIKTKIDIQNFINYNITEIFCGNTDWPANNVSLWRYNTDDGKYHPEAPYGQDGRWRWMIKDTDFGFGLYGKSVSHDTLSYAAGDRIEGSSNPSWATFLFKTLLNNTEFRNQFINSFADQLNTTFVSERVLQFIKEFEETLSPEMLEHSNRWQSIKVSDGNAKDSSWAKNVQVIKDYAKNRPANVVSFIKNKFKSNGVTGTAKITLKTDSQKGYIRINSIDIKSSTPSVKDPNAWEGTYFTGIPVTVKAISKDGYVFDHWEGIDGNSDTLTFDHKGDVVLTAVFRSKSDIPTATPTITPIPTAEPTIEPTTTPIPTVEPTVEPTATPIPTAEPTVEPTPTDNLENLAQGKVASSDSEEIGRGNFASNAVDGNELTRWCAADGGLNHWLKVDLGKAYNLSGTEVIWENDGKNYKYIIEGSTDDLNWSIAVDKTNNTSTSQIQIDDFNAVGVRYIRITITGLDSLSWASIYEFKVKGSEQVTATPTTTPTATPTPTTEPTVEPTVTPIPTAEPTTEPTTTPSTVCGDVNQDGTFNSIDFGFLRMYLLSFTIADPIEISAGDVDDNGVVNAIDFALMRQHLLGIIDKFPAE